MPVNFLSETERLRLNSFPSDLSNEDLIGFFTLSPNDLHQIPANADAANRLGFAVQLVLLRFLGFHLPELTAAVPDKVVDFVAAQINVAPERLDFYGKREQTRSDHQRRIEKYLGYRSATPDDLQFSTEWLTTRSLEHDRPILLLQLLGEHLQNERLVRPGLTILEKMVGTARENAEREIHRRLTPLLDEFRTRELDKLLKSLEPHRPSPLAWLRSSAVSNTPQTILETLTKLDQLQEWKVGEWDLSALNPNRRKQLAQIGFRATAQGLSRMPDQKRHPILLALLYQLHEEVLDELVELFDRMLQKVISSGDRKFAKFQQEIAGLANDKIKILHHLVQILLDPNISDGELRNAIYRLLPEEKLRITFDECERLAEPLNDNSFKLMASRYSYLRRFVPTFLDTLPLDGNAETASLRQAIEILRELDADGRRKIPDDAPVDFIDAKWRQYVFPDEDKISRRFYELCTLFELRANLRSGNVWVEGSRRYAKLDSYLIPIEQWRETRVAVCELLDLPEDGAAKLSSQQSELEFLYEQFDAFLDDDQAARKAPTADGAPSNVIPFKSGKKPKKPPKPVNVRIKNGKLVVTKLAGEEQSASLLALEALVSERLPEVELTDTLIEVDRWTRFSRFFEHPNGNEPRSREALAHCYASILAQACNFGLIQMSRMSGFSYRKLAWHTTWYLREETLKNAFTELVNF